VTGLWFSPGTLIYSTNKTDSHDTTEILLKAALNTIKQYITRHPFTMMKILLCLRKERLNIPTLFVDFCYQRPRS
jgi:hypothetical protein